MCDELGIDTLCFNVPDSASIVDACCNDTTQLVSIPVEGGDWPAIFGVVDELVCLRSLGFFLADLVQTQNVT